MPKTASGLGRPGPGVRYAAAAGRDLDGILRYTQSRFGRQQRDLYARLIDAAAALIAVDPMRPGSRARNDLLRGLRSFSVEQATRRRGGAAHLLYYLPEILADGHPGIAIVRVLHSRMDPTRHPTDEI